MPERNWSTKTLARQLIAYYLATPELNPGSTLEDLFDRLSASIVEEEVGKSLEISGDRPKATKRPDPRDPQS